MKRLLLLIFITVLGAGAAAQNRPAIYPTPQQIEWGKGEVKLNHNKIAHTTDAKIGKEGYILEVSKKGISITSSTPRGAFYARQTLNQLVDEYGQVPVVKITDAPSVRFRGVVEGFYGTPWSHRDRLAQFVFYGQNKLNTYIYGPKDDPYHSSLADHADGTNKGSGGSWRDPYPQKEADQIIELAQTAAANQVDFVWAVHPGKDIKWTDEDFQIMVKKFDAMYGLGVRSFAVFFDDISGEGTNPHRQAELLNRLNRDFVQKRDGVTPLIMCPTEYNKSWANPTDSGYLAVLGRELDKEVEIMWTGDRVCADITTETLEWITARIKRPAYIWWNFPVTDYIRHMVLQGPSYGLTTKTDGLMSGFVSNPMEHAEASKIALFGVADYTWNPAKYDYIAAWEEGIKRIAGPAAKAYRAFAIHSADLEKNGHGYRRDESWETNTTDLASLARAFDELGSAEAGLVGAIDPALEEELAPWLTQATALGKLGKRNLALYYTAKNGAPHAIWNAWLDGDRTAAEQKAYNDHKVGTLKLMPWITATRDSVARALYTRLGGKLDASPNAKAKLYNTVERVAGQSVTDQMNHISIAPILEPFTVAPGAYFGIELPSVMNLEKVDVSLSGNGWRLKREFSDNGTDWSEKATSARFIRWINPTNKEVSARLTAFNMAVMPLASDRSALSDGDLRSGFKVEGAVVIDVPEGATGVVVLGDRDARADVEGYCNALALAFVEQDIPSGTNQIVLKNAGGVIRELIWKY